MSFLHSAALSPPSFRVRNSRSVAQLSCKSWCGPSICLRRPPGCWSLEGSSRHVPPEGDLKGEAGHLGVTPDLGRSRNTLVTHWMTWRRWLTPGQSGHLNKTQDFTLYICEYCYSTFIFKTYVLHWHFFVYKHAEEYCWNDRTSGWKLFKQSKYFKECVFYDTKRWVVKSKCICAARAEITEKETTFVTCIDIC